MESFQNLRLSFRHAIVTAESNESLLEESDRDILLNHYKKLTEQKKNAEEKKSLLESVLSEYCMKENIHRAFYELSRIRLDAENEKYERKLENISESRAQHDALRKTFLEEASVLEKKLDEVKQKKEEHKTRFEETFNAFLEAMEPSQNRFIRGLIKSLATVRVFLSAKRSEFIKVQNTLEEIKMRTMQADQISEGFTTTEYERIKGETELEIFKRDMESQVIESSRKTLKKISQRMEKIKSSETFDSIEERKRELAEKCVKLSQLREEFLNVTKRVNEKRTLRSKLETRAGVMAHTNLPRHFDALKEKCCSSV